MSNIEDFFYNAPVSIYKGPSLYLFSSIKLSEYQSLLKDYVLAAAKKRQSSQENEAGLSINPKIMKVKWKYLDRMHLPAIPARFRFDDHHSSQKKPQYEANMVFIRVSPKVIHRFCLLTRLHIESSKDDGSSSEYLTQRVVLLANASAQMIPVFIDFLARQFDAAFKPIRPLSPRFMLAQYDLIFSTLRNRVNNRTLDSSKLMEENSFIDFDVASTISILKSLAQQKEASSSTIFNQKRTLGYGNLPVNKGDVQYETLEENSLQDITISITGNDMLMYYEWIENQRQQQRQQPLIVETGSTDDTRPKLTDAIIQHYYDQTGINLAKLQVKRISTKSLVLNSNGGFKLLKKGFLGYDNHNDELWIFIQLIIEQ